MHTIKLPAEIDHNHQIHLQLPNSIKVGKANVIVMIENDINQKIEELKKSQHDPLFLQDLQQVQNDFDVIDNEGW